MRKEERSLGRKPKPGVEDLGSKFPDVAAEAHGWDPSQVFAFSSQKLEWRCSKGHIFIASVGNRTSNKSSCPYCSGNKVLKGFNDLQTRFPELATEAHDWDPSQVTFGSGKKLFWRCSLNHLWEISPNQRTSNDSGCPYCSNNRVLSGFNDLATVNPELAREANGWDPSLVSEKSLKKKLWKCLQNHEWLASPADRSRGDGCPYCGGKKVLPGFNDLSTTHPDLAREAHGWDPKNITFGSNKSKKWICNKGHIWSASPNTRSNGETGCPYCSNQKVLAGFNDLKTTHPEIANQAYGWDPSKLTYGSNKKVRWLCENGHKWVVSPAVRSGKNGSGCPACAESGFNPLLPGWLYLLNHELWNLQQIGITNFPEQRIKTHERLGWELIDLRGPLSGDVAAGWEKTILKHIKNRGGISPKPKDFGKFTGFTESWTKKSFLAKDIFSLMKDTGDL